MSVRIHVKCVLWIETTEETSSYAALVHLGQAFKVRNKINFSTVVLRNWHIYVRATLKQNY